MYTVIQNMYFKRKEYKPNSHEGILCFHPLVLEKSKNLPIENKSLPQKNMAILKQEE